MLFDTTPTIAKITHHGCYGGVVEAFCDTCSESLVFVNFITSGNDFIITKFGTHPRLSVKDVNRAGDLIDVGLAKEAQRLGVTKLFIILSGDRVEFVRDYKLHPSVLAMPYKSNTQYIN